MKNRMHTVRLPNEMTDRLTHLAEKTKRTKSYFIREALDRTIEDLEDAYLAETAYEEFIKSGDTAVDLKDVEQSLGVGR